MPIITKITAQRQKGHYNIFIDDEFAFGLDEDTLVSAGLQKGQKLTRFEIEQLEKQSDIGKLTQNALRFLEVRPRSESEVRQRLDQKVWQSKSFTHLRNVKEGEKTIDAVIEKLKSLNYLNDHEFAKWWVEQRQSAKNPKGERLIKAELLKKGLSNETILDILEATTNKMASEEASEPEEALALRSAQKKLKAYQDLPKMEFKRKMGAYLARRGFDWEVIQTALEKVVDTKPSLL